MYKYLTKRNAIIKSGARAQKSYANEVKISAKEKVRSRSYVVSLKILQSAIARTQYICLTIIIKCNK